MKNCKDGSLLFLRVVIAAIFFYAAYGKWGYLMSGAVTGGMAILLWALVIVEPIVGAALLVGYRTKLASLVLAVIMVGAILMLKFTMGSSLFTSPAGIGLDYNFLILAGSLVLYSFGAGKHAMEK